MSEKQGNIWVITFKKNTREDCICFLCYYEHVLPHVNNLIGASRYLWSLEQKLFDTNRKKARYTVNFSLPSVWGLCRWKSSHAFITDRKNKTPARCSAVFLNYPGMWNLLLIYLLRGNCGCVARRVRLQIDFGLPLFVLITLSCEFSLPLNILKTVSKRAIIWDRGTTVARGDSNHTVCAVAVTKWEYRCGSAVIWLQKLAEAKAYWIFKYHSLSGNSADLRDSPLNTTFTSHSLEFMQNIG